MSIIKVFGVISMVLLTILKATAQLPKPTRQQLEWQKLETTAFLHFTVNTFTGKEWGDGTESPGIFNPVDFDARKMIKVLKETGFKMAIITAKHHDGFCLWPSAYTKHSVKSSPWKQGKGDVVKDIADACKEYGIKFGFYLSPWDQHEKSYGTAQYNAFYKNQLTELLSNYGEVAEVWFDGAKGKNARDMEYDFVGYWQLVRKLQPNAVMFSDAGPDVRWVGNESGNAGETCWSTIDTTGLAPGKADPKYLNTGDADGMQWIPAETDVSIRPGWFYHAEEDSKVKTGKQLVDLYYQSVGRNSLLLLNIPPNKKGLFNAEDTKQLYAFRAILNETFKTNLGNQINDSKLTDHQLQTYTVVKPGQQLDINLGNAVTFDRTLLQENITNGQRNEEILLEYQQGNAWKKLAQTTTIGYKRLLRHDPVTTSRLRITVLKAKLPVQLAELGLYKASAKE